MYKVVFAEDEATIRENVSRVIDWEKYDFQIVAMAADGEEALNAIAQHHPDVLITDIRMPFMDGLELSRQAKRLVPLIKIIILSGFMEFSYAQEAIQIGVQDYLVKPITPMKLVKILTKLHGQFEDEAGHKARYHQLVDSLRDAEQRLREAPGGNLSANDLTDILQAEKKLSEFLRIGESAQVEAFTASLFQLAGQRPLQSSLFRYYFILKILSGCVKAVEDMNGDPHEVLPQTDDISAFIGHTVRLETAQNMVCDCLRAVLAWREVALNATAGTVDRAKVYIETHYGSPELSARQVADAVSLSPNYFSNVFKQYTGVSFVRYLTAFRMEKAKALLRTSDLSVVEIAEKVGYSNPNYFSSVFHRLVKCTPLKYREGEDA